MAKTKLKYTGTTPGADSNTYVLYSTTVASPYAKGFFALAGISRYAVHLVHSHLGTLNWYVSNDRGTNWRQVGTQAVAAVANEGTWEDILVEGFDDFKVEWVNGGTAQSPWIVDQTLTCDRSDAA